MLTSQTAVPEKQPAPPSPRATGEIENCTAWHAPKDFNTCYDVLMLHKLSLDELYRMNPSIGADCTGMVAGTYYCLSTYPGGIPLGIDGEEDNGSSTVTTEAPTTTQLTTPTPTQSGMIDKCTWFCFVKIGDGCWDIANDNNIALDDFYAWNPAVKTDCSGLQAKVYVCVRRESEAPTPTTVEPTGILTPTPIQSSIVEGCTDFYFVQAGDDCWSIAEDNKIALEEFYAWNPCCQDRLLWASGERVRLHWKRFTSDTDTHDNSDGGGDAYTDAEWDGRRMHCLLSRASWRQLLGHCKRQADRTG